jgi:phenol hydroxylase P5 protein
MLDLAVRYPNFRYVPVLSEPNPQCQWKGLCGFVHEAAVAVFSGNFSSLKAYLCGPPAMIDACIRTLMQGRLFERDIHIEKFVTLGDGEKALARSPLFKHL